MPLTFSVPIELPGAMMPPLATRAPTRPVPFSTPPLFTVTAPAMLPFTMSDPALTVVRPV